MYMQVKTIGPMKMEWTGIKTTLFQTLLVGAAAGASYLIALAKGYNFGTYEALAMVLLTMVINFLTKFFGSYNVPLVVSKGGSK